MDEFKLPHNWMVFVSMMNQAAVSKWYAEVHRLNGYYQIPLNYVVYSNGKCSKFANHNTHFIQLTTAQFTKYVVNKSKKLLTIHHYS